MQTFVLCLGAYITGWMFCNVFTFQLAARIDSKWQQRKREEMIEEISVRTAAFVINRLSSDKQDKESS